MTVTFVRVAVVLALLTAAPAGAGLVAEPRESGTARSATRKVMAVYPELARNARLEGKVKLSVLVTPAGTVKKVDVIGGHPVFVVAASNAAMQWQFEPAAKESSETLVFSFERPR